MHSEAATTYLSVMEQAETKMRGGNYDEAEILLKSAHVIGHNVKSDHLRAHRALIKLGFLRRKPWQVISQSALLVLAWVFERR